MREYLDIRFFPSGGMNSDADPLYKKNGDYGIDTKNIHFLTQLGESTYAIEPTLGNFLSYALPEVFVQNKVYRIFVETPVIPLSGGAYELRLIDMKGTAIASAHWTPVTSDVAATYNAIIVGLSGFTAAGQTFIASPLTIVTPNSFGYFDLEITTVTSIDYILDIGNFFSSQLPITARPIIIQEPIDTSIAGKLLHIGSYNLENDVIVWSTTQRNLPSEILIQNVTASPNAPLIRITSAGHGLQTGERVQIKGVIYGALLVHEANGSWIVNVIDPNNFDLYQSTFLNVANPGSGVIVKNPSGIGEIGVAQRNDNDQSWTYTTLLRTREWNFVTKKQPKTYCEKNDILTSIYWTDNYNTPRVFYYAGGYFTNGGLSYVNVLGEYEYGSIAVETILIKNNNNSNISFDSQLQGGGGVLAGNHRYCYRFIAANGSPTLWSDPTNEVNVFQAILPSPAASVFGNNSDDVTSKINQFIITGITANLFKYVELADIYYTDGAPVGTIIRRDLLTQQTTQIIQHTGLETGVQTLDLASLLEIQQDIRLAKNIDAVDKRLVLSNITSSQAVDFSEVSQTFKHKLLQKSLDGVLSRYAGTLRVGEFELPENLFNYAGYMLNETYRFGVKYKLKNGSITSVFWVDDIRFDDYSQGGVAFNRGNPFGDNRREINGSLPSMALTNFDTSQVYTFGLQITGINWEALIDGIPLKDLVDQIIPERIEMDIGFREVLGSGLAVMATRGSFGVGPVEVQDQNGTTFDRNVRWEPSPFNPSNSFNYFTDFFAATGLRFDNPVGTPLPGQLNPPYSNYTSASPYSMQLGSFYCPDFLFSESDWSFIPGDQFINYGQPPPIQYGGLTAVDIGGNGSNEAEFFNKYRELSGVPTTNLSVDLIESAKVLTGQSIQLNFISNAFYCKQWHLSTFDPIFPSTITEESLLNAPSSPVFVVSSDIIPGTPFPDDFGTRIAQIYRPKLNKFGDIRNGKYIPTGSFLIYSGFPVSTVDVWGGDVMTQKTWILHKQCVEYSKPSGGLWDTAGLSGGFSFYSQNHVNSSMVNRNDSGKAYKYPFINEVDWLNGIALNAYDAIYTHGYDIKNGISSDEAFDPNLKRSTRQPARICYSDEKPENSLVDNFTSFLPLNFKDLQLAFGEISHHLNVNSQLMTWQQDHFEFQYFNSTGLLVTNAQEAVLGNAGVMSQRGTALSTYGTSHGFSVIKGKTAGGKDCMCWISTKYGKVIKHDPSQGTSVISDVQFMRSFFNNNLRFAGLYDTPADGLGIHGVWDDENSEFIWTVRAHKNVPQWVAGIYNVGDEVIYGADNFHEIPDIYVCHINGNNSVPSNGNGWTKIDISNSLYYNYYTVCYNEVKNKFTTFYSFLPKIYLKRGKLFLSPRPVNDESKCYEHLRGEYCVWYKDGSSELSDQWKISGMNINEQPNIEKSFKAMMWQVQSIPLRVEVKTKNYQTYMLASDFQQRGDQCVVAVKNDTAGGSFNDQDTSSVFGTYAEVGISGPPRTYNKFINFIMKSRIMSRVFSS